MPALNSPIESITKLTKPQIAALKKLGVLSVKDILLYFPYRYLDFSKIKKIKDLTAGENVSISGKIKTISGRFSFRGRVSLAEAIISDDTGSIKIVWFNQAYLAEYLKTGDEIFIAGEPQDYNGILQLVNPIYEKASDFPIHTARLLPLYHLTAKIYNKTLRNIIAKALPFIEKLVDDLPAEILTSQNLLALKETVRGAHFPESMENVDNVKKRLAFEEVFINQLAARQYKLKLAEKQAFAIKFDQVLIKKFVDSLPFKLTDEQKRASWEVIEDIQKAAPMNRLLEGDVGSGKTLVALIAVLQTVADGYQAAFLAPTEILAKQHFETSLKFLISFFHGREKMICALLTNSYLKTTQGEITKPDLLKIFSDGTPGLYIGTHALLQNKIKFSKLALVIIDEQHRFGVDQRAKLLQTDSQVPHLLSLSATPIPRSLQLAFYGELDISRIKEKPADRKPIITRLAPKEKRALAYDFIKKQIQSGRQVFVITPLIEESDKLGVKSAKKEFEVLKKIFPEFAIGLLHGRLKGKDKEAVMNDFLNNKIQILISTSVVEVGVDAPNASVMVIEGAERFGLAQLHQFRGRVGRAEHQSFCILFTSPPKIGKADAMGRRDGIEDESQKRLELFTKTQDGFELAELDLKLRGFGEIYGSTQSGIDYKYFNPSYTSLIQPAREEAKKLLTGDINLEKYPLLKEKITGKTIHFE